MAKWFRATSWAQRIAVVLLILALISVFRSVFVGDQDASGLVVFTLLFAFFAFRHEMLWRVRNRLLLTFFLFGVVPIVLIGLMLAIVTELGLGQMAVQRARQDLANRIQQVDAAARAVATGSSALPAGMSAIVAGPERKLLGEGPLREVPAGSDVAGLWWSEGKPWLAAKVTVEGKTAFAYEDARAVLPHLAKGAALLPLIANPEEDVDVKFQPTNPRVMVKNGNRGRIVNLGQLPPATAWWDMPVANMFAQPIVGQPSKNALIVVLTRPSMINAGMWSGTVGQTLAIVVLGFGGLLLIVEMFSLMATAALTRTVTRSVHDLYQGTLRVAEGDFAHEIPVRGKHQLSELAKSFNGMTAKIRDLIVQTKQKEKLESELAIARGVQLALFPRSVPELKTLELAGVCIPGRIVSGDYYDHVKLDDRYTAIALGDVSGKGVSAALLMASIQSAFHAQLKYGASVNPSVSSSKLMELISQQLYENTPPEKYATFFCSIYDDDTGRLRYTNAGHLPPILVRDGEARPLEGDGMVAGLLPNVKYQEHEILLHPGDVVCLFSDGVPEAENKDGQEFGDEHLREILREHADDPLDKILKMITGAVEEWAADPDARDDTTVLVVRRKR